MFHCNTEKRSEKLKNFQKEKEKIENHGFINYYISLIIERSDSGLNLFLFV